MSTIKLNKKQVFYNTVYFLLGVVFLLCALTYDPSYTSFNSVSSLRENQHMGHFFYYIAELFIQHWGLASLYGAAVLMLFPWRVQREHHWFFYITRWLAFLITITLMSFWLEGAGHTLGVLRKVPAIDAFIISLPSGKGGLYGYQLHQFLTASVPPKLAPYVFALEDLLVLYFIGLLTLYTLGWRLKDSFALVHHAIRKMVNGLMTVAHAAAEGTQKLLAKMRGVKWVPKRRVEEAEEEEDLMQAATPEEDYEEPHYRAQKREPVINMGSHKPAAAAAPEAENNATRLTPFSTSATPAKNIPTAERHRIEMQAGQPTADGSYVFPDISILNEPSQEVAPLSSEELESVALKLMAVLKDFGIKGEIVGVSPGPVVTQFELEPAPGMKSARVIGLAEDIARSMSAHAARVSVIPGRNAIGIELPNEVRETVYLREILSSKTYLRGGHKLPLALGKDIAGQPVIADLAKMPHLLVAGTTGSGKSVGINAMILSLLYKHTPETCKFIMIDPKMLELSVYEGIPHLLSPVVTNPKKAVVALKWVVKEMENRYMSMSQLGVRNLEGFNNRVKQAQKNGEVLSRRVQTGFDPETGMPIYEDQPLDLEPLPNIVVVVDEMADLMLVAGKDIEAAIQRLAQMARAAGIHLIMATQRPSVDVITGTIKANFPTRISFQVTSKIDSRTILGEQGAEQLLGQGDMLHMASGGKIVRVHGPFVSDKEVDQIVKALKKNGPPAYTSLDVGEDDTTIMPGDSGMGFDMPSVDSGDDTYDKAISVILAEGRVSTSFIQRQLGIGYNRAANIIERMEKEGVVSPPNRTGKREILIKK